MARTKGQVAKLKAKKEKNTTFQKTNHKTKTKIKKSSQYLNNNKRLKKNKN